MSEEKIEKNPAKKPNWFARHKKALWITFAVIAVVIALVLTFLGTVVKFAGENVGPMVTGGPIKIGWAYINLFTGKIYIRNVAVGNPTDGGFATPDAVTVKKVDVDIDMPTVFGNKMVIREVTVDGVKLFYEQKGLTNNLEALKKNVDNFQRKLMLTSDNAADKPKNKKTASEPKKLQLDHLSVTDVNVYLAVGVGQFKAGAPIPVVPVVLDRLGAGPDGITGIDIVQRVLDKITLGAFDALAGQLGSGFKSVIGAAGDTGKSIGGLFSREKAKPAKSGKK